MKIHLFFALMLVTFFCEAQSVINVCITDINKEPIAYAELGIVGVAGTISDIDGNVKWLVSDTLLHDTLSIYCVGYESKKMTVSYLLQSDTILLDSKIELIEEVVVRGSEFVKKKIGIKRHKRFSCTLYYPTRVATVISKPDSSLSYVWRISFYVREIIGKPKIRIQLHSIDSLTGFPNVILNKKDLIYRVKREGWNTIELKDKIELPQSGLICSFQILDNKQGNQVLLGGHMSKNKKMENRILSSYAFYTPWEYFSLEEKDEKIFLSLAVTLDILQEEKNISFFKRFFR